MRNNNNDKGICTASADKDVEYLYHCLDEVEKIINEIKEGLKS